MPAYLINSSDVSKSVILRKCEERGINVIEIAVPVELEFSMNLSADHGSFICYRLLCNRDDPAVATFIKNDNASGMRQIIMSRRYTPYDFEPCVRMTFDEWLDSQKDGGTNNCKAKDVTLK
jgi:hypothetical protein